MSAFEEFADTPYYSVLSGSKQLLYGFNEDDMEKGKERLLYTLEAAVQNGHDDLLLIRFHEKPAKGMITDKTPYYSSMMVRVNELNTLPVYNPAAIGRVNYQDNQILAELKTISEQTRQMKEDLESRLLALETADTDEDPETEPDMIGRITGVLNNPHMPVILDMLKNIFPNLFNPATRPNVAVSGLPKLENTMPTVTEEKKTLTPEEFNAGLTLQLQRLTEHCNILECLTKLADIAESKPATFQNLILMLNSY
ncbi:MAG: hypothetical protein V4501_12235 [Pseudomonadota bacterium]